MIIVHRGLYHQEKSQPDIVCHVVAAEVLFAFIPALKYENCIYFISTHTVAALILSNCLGDPIGFIL